MKCCVRCEEIFKEDENIAELNGANYHFACLVADLLEQIAILKDQLKDAEVK